jgi:hypothetical protein
MKGIADGLTVDLDALGHQRKSHVFAAEARQVAEESIKTHGSDG